MPVQIGSPEHLELAREIQRKSLVLLVNRPVPSPLDEQAPAAGRATTTAPRSASRVLRRRAREGAAAAVGGTPLLPLRLDDVKKVLVFGALSDAREHLLGTYYNKPSGGA